MANRAQIIGIGLDGKTREPRQIQQSEIAKKSDLEEVQGTIPSTEDVAANTAASHTQNTDQGLDEGGSNEVTAAEIVTAIADIAGKFPELPYDLLFTSASNNAPGRYHVPGVGQTSANFILGTLDQYFYIDLSQGPASCDITVIGGAAGSDIITFPGGNVTTATVHTFDPSDRGVYRYWLEDLGATWRLHVELLHERKAPIQAARFYIDADSGSFTTTFTQVPFNVAATPQSWVANSGGELTLQPGTYLISTDITIGESAGNNRTEFESKLQTDSSGSYADIDGTIRRHYSRNSTQGAQSASITNIPIVVTTAHNIRAMSRRRTGSNTGLWPANGSSITILKIA